MGLLARNPWSFFSSKFFLGPVMGGNEFDGDNATESMPSLVMIVLKIQSLHAEAVHIN